MVDYADSSQLNYWLFQSPDEINLCRAKANYNSRLRLAQRDEEGRKKKKEQKRLQEVASNNNNNNNEGGGGAGAATTTTTTANGEGESAVNSNNSNNWTISPTMAKCFARGFSRRLATGEEELEDYTAGPWETAKGHAYLNPQEEATLVSFYVSKLPTLIGPKATIPRLRRESKVTATAALLLRRFYLSNSVHLFDPKVIMVAAAWMGSKVEDAMTDVRYLEEGTAAMNAAVTMAEIIPAELALVQGTHFDLVCFHPYKAVLALTEDLRTYLKSDKGKALVMGYHGAGAQGETISGQDLKPMYEAARQLVDDSTVSDLPLLYSPGHIGLAALMVAQEQVQDMQRQAAASEAASMEGVKPPHQPIPRIDLMGYMRQRFENEEQQQSGDSSSSKGKSSSSSSKVSTTSTDELEATLKELCQRLQALKNGEYGCGHYNTDMAALKGIHKKLKKVRAWGTSEKDKGGGDGKDTSGGNNNNSKVDKKNKKKKTDGAAEDMDVANENNYEEPKAKRAK